MESLKGSLKRHSKARQVLTWLAIGAVTKPFLVTLGTEVASAVGFV